MAPNSRSFFNSCASKVHLKAKYFYTTLVRTVHLNTGPSWPRWNNSDSPAYGLSNCATKCVPAHGKRLERDVTLFTYFIVGFLVKFLYIFGFILNKGSTYLCIYPVTANIINTNKKVMHENASKVRLCW